MKISVIIPVYNAEKYVARAVESALQQEECGEVILVEDGSPDNALEVCRRFSATYENVYLYQHENQENRGPGPSRNLGVLKARFDYIAFLDADDVYLPGRFTKAVELLSQNDQLDGVYEPVGSCFENEEARQRYFAGHSNEVAMVTKIVDPEDLFECLVSGRHGYIHPNGLLLKKKAFFDVGMIPEFRLHEDTLLIFKLSLLCRLAPGEIRRPVSTRLLHMDNVITKPGIDFLKSRYLCYDFLLQWMKKNNIEKNRIRLVKSKYLPMKYRLLRKEGRYFSAIFYYANSKLSEKIGAMLK